MTTPSLATEAALAGNYPMNRFNQRERKLLASVKTYVDALTPGADPSHYVKFAGTATTAGGAAAEAITVTGVAATDLVFIQIKQQGATPRTVLKAVPTTNTITVTFSGDPSTDHIIFYQVLRAAV